MFQTTNQTLILQNSAPPETRQIFSTKPEAYGDPGDLDHIPQCT